MNPRNERLFVLVITITASLIVGAFALKTAGLF